MKSTAIGKICGLMVLSRFLVIGMAMALPADSLKLKALTSTKVAAAYPFIKENLNKLYNPEPANLVPFYQALDSLKAGTRKKVNIVHIGDSHIQADIFTGRMRNLLQADTAFGNGGRGLVFPYPLAKTNNPWNYKVNFTGNWSGCRNIQASRECAWGLAGITAETTDSTAAFSLNTSSQSGGTPVNRVKVFFQVSDISNYTIVVRLTGSTFISGRLDASGFIEFLLPTEVFEVKFVFRKTEFGQTHFVLQGVMLENDRKGIQYSALGINGAEVTSFLRCPDLENNLKVLKPDLIIISLGTNDAYGARFDADMFFLNYGTLLQRLNRASPGIPVILTTPGDTFRNRKYANTNTVKAVGKIYELAEEIGFSVWNFYHIMGGFKSVAKWQGSGLAARDRVHFSGKGYRLQGDLLFNALMKDYEAFRKKVN